LSEIDIGNQLFLTWRQLLFNPNHVMVEVLSRDGIESKKKAATCHPTDDVQDRNLGRIEQFSACGKNQRCQGKIKGVRNLLLTFGDSFGIFHGSWDDQSERQMVG